MPHGIAMGTAYGHATTLVRRADGSVTAVGVQRGDEVCICKAGAGCLEISKVVARVYDDLSVRF